jgi:hypothetical protein
MESMQLLQKSLSKPSPITYFFYSSIEDEFSNGIGFELRYNRIKNKVFMGTGLARYGTKGSLVTSDDEYYSTYNMKVVSYQAYFTLGYALINGDHFTLLANVDTGIGISSFHFFYVKEMMKYWMKKAMVLNSSSDRSFRQDIPYSDEYLLKDPSVMIFISHPL